jgi:hypothetical protein
MSDTEKLQPVCHACTIFDTLLAAKPTKELEFRLGQHMIEKHGMIA